MSLFVFFYESFGEFVHRVGEADIGGGGDDMIEW